MATGSNCRALKCSKARVKPQSNDSQRVTLLGCLWLVHPSVPHQSEPSSGNRAKTGGKTGKNSGEEREMVQTAQLEESLTTDRAFGCSIFAPSLLCCAGDTWIVLSHGQ